MPNLINVQNGQNLIRIESDGYSDCLKINNVISSILWSTDYHYYAVSKDLLGLEFLKLDKFNFDIKDDESNLLMKTQGLLKLFQSGNYQITRQTIKKEHYLLAHNNFDFKTSLDNDKGEFTYCVYTECDLIAFTKPFEQVDYGLVEGYKYQILENEQSPVIVTFSSSFNDGRSFIIDGHCKILAYNDLGLDVNIINIAQIEPETNYNESLKQEYNSVMNKSELKHYKRRLK